MKGSQQQSQFDETRVVQREPYLQLGSVYGLIPF